MPWVAGNSDSFLEAERKVLIIMEAGGSSFKVQLALGFIISWFLFQSKSNLNPDAKEFIPGVKY